MKQCIICREYKDEKEFNKEHVIPESIGGSLTIEDVCKTCNNRLGKIDKLLTDNLFIKASSIDKNVLNKKGKLPVLFPKLVKNNPRIIHKTKRDSEGKIKYENTTSISKNENTNDFTVTLNPNESPEQQLKHIRNFFKKKYNHILSEEEESKIIYSLKHEQNTIEDPSFPINIKVDFKKLSKAYIKIAYEIAYYILGEKYLKDPIGIKLSESLLKENKYLNSDGIFFMKPMTIEKYDEHVIHFISIRRYKDKIEVRIFLFNLYNYCIIISENAELYDNFKESFIIIAFFYDETTKQKWFKKYDNLTFYDFISDYIEKISLQFEFKN